MLGVAFLPWAAQAQQPVEDPPGLSSTLAGRVCDDRDGDGRCAPEEPGVPGVRLVLATGSEVRTDSRGRYHFTGVDSRTPDATGGVHLRPGRHRLRVDPRTLPPGGRASVEAATVEVPWGAVVLQDFAVRIRVESVQALASAPAEAPPQAEIREEGVAFVVTGQASPGDQVRIADTEAQVDADGTYRSTVLLRAGENVLSITATSPGGTARFFRQRVDAVRREGSWLLAPRAIEPVGVLRLPAGREEEVPSGASSLRVEAPQGTRVRTSQGEVTVGPQGEAEVPILLSPGRNRVELELERPGESPWKETVSIVAVARPFFVGLLDLEGAYSLGDGAFQLHGRGAAHVEARLGELQLLGELDLRDTDFRTLRREDAAAWLRPRLPERFERSLDPERAIDEWGDDSVGLAPNAAEGRLRLEARHDAYGRAGVGTYRALMADGEIGRYHQPLFGPFAELKTEAGPVRLGVNAFAGSLTDPVRGLSTRPAHEELHATGGSLYFLGAAAVVEGSELLRVELRDGLTGLPLAEQHLIRGRDYEIDYAAGRILLARPLSFLTGYPWLRTDALTAAPEPVLVADYAALELSGSRDTAGGEAWAEWGGTRVSLAAVRERRAGAPYGLFSGRARGALGGYTLEAEVAHSSGQAISPGVFGVSDDGGLTYLRPGADLATGGEALGVRVHGPGPLEGGSVDAAFRWRDRGFSDGAHTEAALFRQLSLRASQPVGDVRLTLLGDDRRSADPRLPFAPSSIAARTLGVGASYERESWSVRLELRDAWLRASEVAGEGPVLAGGRTSVGLQGRLRVHERVVLSAGHRQALLRRGEGPGSVDDSFASAGVDVQLDEDTTVGLRGGWGPELGPQVWANAASRRGPEVFYGGYSVDVDGPDFGAGRAVMGARTELEGGASVFVEDISAHDANAVRRARAVGFQQAVFGGLQVGGRYERGVRNPLDLPSSLTRDSGGLFGQLVRERLRVDARAEVRRERGTPVRGAQGAVDRLQAVVALAAEALLREDLSLSGRVNFARTVGAERLEERLLEGSAAAAWRPGPFLVVARYSVTRELLPGARGAFGDRALQVLSLLPAVRLGDRVSVAAGLHAGRSSLGDAAAWVGTGTLRPSVRVVGGLETAVEVARRTSAHEGGSLSALRAEVGYRVDEGLRFAAGYTVLGFSGLGLSEETTDESDRLYLRAELAY
ncbi:flagellar motor protein [Hyalangium sp.]|uniref:flagellar motor protein n=1 Tax=Hyalangium sp. TaxID=2028555 RepID=UPI002D6606DF|nr:flagellar motor protein [Hyalangium sp.]HYH99577.1 flagellar motor protein [Hyalangium sp.]